ncbi:hypothetical protein DL93DRAFT_2085278 [Clavulina sp. PMI_390]|nr:hypothetical protein DL93DRAFT_2085278 [Clavulina sp. PMI_390]
MRPDKVQTVRRKPLQTRTRLEVLRGVPPIDSDVVGLDEDTNKHKSLDIDSTGVEHEDAKEEHLVQALAATRRQFESGSVASSSSSNVQIAIPIPNATASVENWEEDYPANQWHDPHAFVQSSDAVEQSIAGFPSKGYSYDMDEKDDAWLRAHNAAVKGEGTSATGARLGKKGAPAVPVPSFVISEDEFEMTMALFEKFTDDMYPYLEVVRSLLLSTRRAHAEYFLSDRM